MYQSSNLKLVIYHLMWNDGKTLVCTCMYVCRYLAAKSEADHYTREMKREEEEIINVPDTGGWGPMVPNIFILP